jgi:sulfotransferase
MKEFNFITGLPRSGTTLLSTILNQNPDFNSEISGPLARFTRAIIEQSSDQGGYRFQCPPEKRKELILALFDTYFKDSTATTNFSTNRGYPLMLPLLKDLFPETKVIACVRDIKWILDSFETLVRKNPYSVSGMFSPEENVNVYTRTQSLLNESRTLGFAYQALKQGYFSTERSMMLIVEYDDLAKKPRTEMERIYKFLGKPYFEHDFDNVEFSFDEFDADINMPGLHTTRKKVSYINRPSIIPPEIQQHVSGMEFWK